MTQAGRYTRTAMVLHWVLAVLIIGNLALGWAADSFPDSAIRSAVDLHKSIGLSALGLVLLRILWRWSHRPPPLPAAYPAWERVAAHAGHALLYVLILALPLSGYLHDSAFKDAAAHPLTLFGLVPFPRLGWIAHMDPAAKQAFHDALFAVHSKLAWAVAGLVAVHVAAALKHQFWDRERELQRIAS